MIEKLKKYYTKAIRTSLLAQDLISKNWIHLFSVIELQNEDEYPYSIPNDEWKKNFVRAKKSKLGDYNFYIVIDEINSVDDAISIFNAPFENYKINDEKIYFTNSSFIPEPTGKYPLILSPNFYGDGLASILPKRKSGILVWCQIDFERRVENQFISSSISKEMLALQSLTLDWLGFDIVQKREHLGNIYLSAPNPYFTDIDISLSLNPVGIFYKIYQRKNLFEPMIFRIIDKHGDAIALDKTFKIENTIGLIELPHEPNLFELRVYNQDNDLIAVHEPATFLKSIKFNTLIKNSDFHVKIETEKGSEEFTIEKFSDVNPFSIGNSEKLNSEYYFKDAENKRQHIRDEKSKEFIFYPGAKSDLEKNELKEKAKFSIREILNNAKDSCYICDPYFSEMDIIDYAFHIKNSNVQINILNSKQFISKIKAKKITEIIKNYNDKPFTDIVVRTLRGESIMHDRFIVVDKYIWFIGSSFNEIGNRATCIAKIPKASGTLIIKEIEKWFHSEEYSQNIVDYANELTNE